MTSQTKREVIKAIRELDRRVTVADVTATTGLSLTEVAEQLNSVAAETQATLEVTKSGQVFYCFPSNFGYTYFAHGFRRALLAVWDNFFKVAFFLFRISFGIILLLSLWFIFGSILIFQSILSAAFGASNEVGYMWRDFLGLVNKVAVWDLISWRKSSSAEMQVVEDESPRQGFLLDCYSFLFGEGNPNEHLEEERWKLLAQVIRLNEGIIIAEHLPPYTGRPADDDSALFKVLSKFSGYPKLSDTGQLVYVFPSMQERSTNSSYAFMPEFIEESPWPFSHLSRSTLRPVIALAVGNFLGSLFFWWIFLFTHRLTQPPALFLFLAIYGTLFVLVPAIRFVVTFVLNWQIKRRNKMVKNFENAIGNPDPETRQKLEEAEKVRREVGDLSPAETQIVYTTKKDYLEQLTDNL